jgi:hypothetical protein
MNVFNVLTTFKFEVASAILNSEKLQSATERLSGAAESALLNYKALGVGLAGSFGLGTGSFLGTIYQAITAAEKFSMTQDAMANILGQNAAQFKNDISSFNTRLQIANSLMSKLAAAGEEFALPQMEMLEMSKLMLPILLNYGVQGKEFQNVVDISRGLLKSAPMLGINPMDVQGQLLRSLTGGASMGDPLFRALVGETKAFDDLKKKNKDVVRAFNVSPITDRVEILRKALLQFGSDPVFLARQFRTLRYQMQALKNNLFGFNGIFIKFGEALRHTFINSLIYINKVISEYGQPIVS